MSYRLVFGDEAGAQNYQRRAAAEGMDSTGLIDPCLGEICALSSSTSNSATSYSVTEDFPILGPRLAKLQDYIQRQDPGTFTMLWQDRRDLYRW